MLSYTTESIHLLTEDFLQYYEINSSLFTKNEITLEYYKMVDF